MKYGIYNAYWTHEWSANYEYYIPKVKRLGFDVLEISCAALTCDYASEEKLRDLKNARRIMGSSSRRAMARQRSRI